MKKLIINEMLTKIKKNLFSLNLFFSISNIPLTILRADDSLCAIHRNNLNTLINLMNTEPTSQQALT